MVGGVIPYHEAGFRRISSVGLAEQCIPVESKFDLPYRLDDTITPEILNMLRRAYSFSGGDFDKLLQSYQHEVDKLSLRYDAYYANTADALDPAVKPFGTLHWPSRAQDMFRLGLLIEVAKDPGLSNELVKEALLNDDNFINLRSILLQSETFQKLDSFEPDQRSKMTPLRHIIGVMRAMDLETLIPELEADFWKEARFWTHLLHDLTKSFGARSPLHTTLGRDFTRTFFWYRNSQWLASGSNKNKQAEPVFSEDMIDTVCFLCEWHHVFMYFKSYLPRDFVEEYQTQKPKDSEKLRELIKNFENNTGDQVEFNFGLLESELPKFWNAISQRPQLLTELLVFTTADTSKDAADYNGVYGPLNAMFYNQLMTKIKQTRYQQEV